jgi:hypothetical protein
VSVKTGVNPGQIDKLELEQGDYNDMWERQLLLVNSNRDDEVDNFFRYWLKAKFADTRKAGQRFDGDYHREMFKEDLNKDLGLEHNASRVKAFLKGEFLYYTNLYARIWNASQQRDPAFPSVFCNNLNDLDSQFLLLLSACAVNDPEESQKIEAVSSGLDRMFTLLQLQGSYDSNQFTERLYEISTDIRERPAAELAGIFNRHLIEELAERRSVQPAQPFAYPLFRPMSVDRLNTRFVRYFFGRVEEFIANGMKLKMKHSLKDLVTLRGAKTGFHVEHILSRNAENLALFDGDEERFDQERGRLGGILLLKGKDNISSNNEVFVQKLKSYANTLYWNETLRADCYKSKLDFAAFAKQENLAFQSYEKFGPEELEARHKLLFSMTSMIWSA